MRRGLIRRILCGVVGMFVLVMATKWQMNMMTGGLMLTPRQLTRPVRMVPAAAEQQVQAEGEERE